MINSEHVKFVLAWLRTIIKDYHSFSFILIWNRGSQWPRGLRRRYSAARLLRLWVRIPPGAWMSVCCEWCVLSGRGLCDGLITRPEKSYRLWRVVVCDQETSKTRRLKPATGLWKIQPQWVVTPGKQNNLLEISLPIHRTQFLIYLYQHIILFPLSTISSNSLLNINARISD